MKIKIYKGDDGQWYWHIKSPNGKILAQGEGYKRKRSAMNVIKVLKAGLAKASVNIES
jgi:uncharacterized protein YegP (UPF0339 family)